MVVQKRFHKFIITNHFQALMQLSYYILENKPIILVKMHGHLDMTNIFTAVEKIWQAPGYTSNLNSIMDLREAEISFSPAEISQFAEFLITNDKTLTGEFVILVSKPFETALSMIFESKMTSRQKTSIFSTEDGAIRHLRLTPAEFGLLKSEKATVITIGNGKEAKESPDH